MAENLLGRALFAPIFETERPNLARFIFLDAAGWNGTSRCSRLTYRTSESRGYNSATGVAPS